MCDKPFGELTVEEFLGLLERPVPEKSLSHDRLCPVQDAPAEDCLVCAAIWDSARDAFNRGWEDGYEEGLSEGRGPGDS